MEPTKRAAENELLHEIFPPGIQKEFVIEAPPEKRRRRRRTRFLGRFPRVRPSLPTRPRSLFQGVPSFPASANNKKWNLQSYPDDAETCAPSPTLGPRSSVRHRGEPGGWMLQDRPGSQTHKGTPSPAEDVKNLVVLKLTEFGTMEVYPIDEAFNFRPTVQHKVFSLEEAEIMMSSKRRPKMAPTLKAHLEAASREEQQREGEESSGRAISSPKTGQESGDSEGEVTQKRKKEKKTKAVAERKIRAARALQPVEATDVLIEQIKPKDVEDWEYSEDEADDDVNMGGDFENQEMDEMEAEYKKYVQSDSSEDEEREKLDEKGKELKKLIKHGAPEYLPPPSMPPEAKAKKKAPGGPEPPVGEEKIVAVLKKPNEIPPPVQELPSPAAKEVPEAKEDASQGLARVPQDLSMEGVQRYLQAVGPLSLRQLINQFRPFLAEEDDKREFRAILKKLTHWEERRGTRILVLRPEYRAS